MERKYWYCGLCCLILLLMLSCLRMPLSAQTICKENLVLLDSLGAEFPCDDFQGELLLIYNNPPQCHECEESIYDFLSQLKVRKSQLYIVFGPYGNALVRLQLQELARRILHDNYSALYYKNTNFDTNIRGNTPIIYFLSDGKITDKFTVQQIFSENMYDDSIRKMAQKKIRRFLNPSTSKTLIK